MSFLENMNNNPEFLNDFLKWKTCLMVNSNITVLTFQITGLPTPKENFF